MKTFWFSYIFCFMLGLLWASGAFAEAYQGLFCVRETASEEVAIAYVHGGYDLEDKVAEALVEKGICFRITESIEAEVVYQGKVIGTKQVTGIAHQKGQKPELFGLMTIQSKGSV